MPADERRGFGASIKAFAKTPVGYIVLVALIVVLSGLALGSLGLIVGGIGTLVVAFGFPIYFGWKGSLKHMLSVAVAVMLVGPLIMGLVVTSSAVVPSPVVSSTDGVLENVTLSPFEAGGGAGPFVFHIDAFPSKIPSRYGVLLSEVYVWITNCQYDTDQSHGNCQLSPAPVFKNLTYALTPAEQNATGVVPINITASGLPSGQIFYFIVMTAVASINDTSALYYALNFHAGGWSCTVQPSYGGCSYTQGPITTSWGGVYELLLLGNYVSMAFVVAVLVALIFVYSYLKARERLRKAQAKAAAQGEAPSSSLEEVRCPSCRAVVDRGESSCWKCGKGLTSSPPVKGSGPEGSPKEGPVPKGTDVPLPSKTGPADDRPGSDG